MNAKDFDKLDKNKNFDISSIHKSKLSKQDSRQGILDEGETREYKLSHIRNMFRPLLNIIGAWVDAKNQETIEKYAGYQFEFGIKCVMEICKICLTLLDVCNEVSGFYDKYGYVSDSKKKRYKKIVDAEMPQLKKDIQILKNVDARRKKMGLPSIKSTLKYMVRDIMANPDSKEFKQLKAIITQYGAMPSSGTHGGPTDFMEMIDFAFNFNVTMRAIKSADSLITNN